MEITERAKLMISSLKSGRTVNSQVFGEIYRTLVGKKWTYTNCIPCIKDAVLEMNRKIDEIEKNGGCLNCKKSPTCQNVWCSNGSCSECQDKIKGYTNSESENKVDEITSNEIIEIKEEPKKRGPKKKS